MISVRSANTASITAQARLCNPYLHCNAVLHCTAFRASACKVTQSLFGCPTASTITPELAVSVVPNHLECAL